MGSLKESCRILVSWADWTWRAGLILKLGRGKEGKIL